MANKPILCLDFDGVLNSYESGWQGATTLPDPPVPGAMEFLDRAVETFDVQIFSSRSNESGGIDAMKLWLHLALLKAIGDVDPRVNQIFAAIKWPTEKPPAFVTIDDRAIQFTGVFPTIPELKGFHTWLELKRAGG